MVFYDPYSHPYQNLYYITESIPSNDLREIFYEQIDHKCLCSSGRRNNDGNNVQPLTALCAAPVPDLQTLAVDRTPPSPSSLSQTSTTSSTSSSSNNNSVSGSGLSPPSNQNVQVQLPSQPPQRYQMLLSSSCQPPSPSQSSLFVQMLEDSHCICNLVFGQSYSYCAQSHDLLLLDDCLMGKRPVYECNDLCACNPTQCFNRRVQFGPRQGLCILKINEYKQFGVRTFQDIPKGAFICEYAGEIITEDEARIRHEFNRERNLPNYILSLYEYYGGETFGDAHDPTNRTETIIDPSRFGNIGRYLNHSCDPNCVLVSVRVNSLVPKVAIFAQKPIRGGEELCFDYGLTTNTPLVRSLTRCLCNSSNCRQFLPYYSSMY